MQTLAGAEDALHHHLEVEGMAIDVSRDLANAILAQGTRGLMPRRRPEVGGILLGRVVDGDTIAVEIEGCVEVPCEHLLGASYSLSGGEAGAFRAAAAEYKPGRRRGIQAVGFYRTHTGRGFALEPEEVVLFSELFPDRVGVALLVKPRLLRPSRAGLFFRDGSSLEFRLSSPGGREARKTPLWCSWWVLAPLLACLLFADGLLGFFAARQVHTLTPAVEAPRDPYALSLMAVEYGDNLFLTWDHKAPPVAAAARATLFIADGGQERAVALTRKQLQAGAVTYRKMSDHIRFRLEVFLDAHRSVTEVWDSASAGRR
jgi:hypothetical protein